MKEKELPQREISSNDFKIIEFFFAFPNKKISLNDLSKAVSLSKTSTHKAVNALIKEKFLEREIIGKMWNLSCNIKHKFNQTKKIPFNLERIYNSEIISLITNKFPNSKAIILFGSYRWGSDNEESDIDIAVELLGNEKLKIEKMAEINIGKRKNVKVNVHIFSRKNINMNLFANISNGIVLDGFLEVNP